MTTEYAEKAKRGEKPEMHQICTKTAPIPHC